MNRLARVWVIDDESSIRKVLELAFKQAELNPRTFASADEALAILDRERPDVIVTDIRMPGLSGLEFLDEIQKRAPEVPVIIMTAHTDLDSAVAAYRGGAFEYLPKPFDIDEAVSLTRRALEQRVQNGEPPAPLQGLPELIGEAPAMQEVFRAIGRLSSSHMNVLIRGESGTGKELVARALQRHSPRAEKALVAINTAAIPADLLESELFGHERGAFTGAQAQRVGRFEQADGGTLFLDEIGDMPAELQTRLLRVLSDRRFYRVGGHDEVEVDVRIVAATNQDLEHLVEQGRFREDLFHRLNVINIRLPALRERQEDIPLLARHFLEHTASELHVEAKTLLPDAVSFLSQVRWPGNVRQLENVCRWLTVMSPAQTVAVSDLPPELRDDGPAADQASGWELELRQIAEQKLLQGENDILGDVLPKIERIFLETALKHTGGHKQDAAKRLGWGRNTLTRKLKELNLDPPV